MNLLWLLIILIAVFIGFKILKGLIKLAIYIAVLILVLKLLNIL